MPMFLERFDLVAHLIRQRDWSERTFGPGDRVLGISDHIRKELLEVAAARSDRVHPDLEALKEWVDVIILALDGAWRTGADPQMIAGAISAKQRINEDRRWPDWRKAELGKAIEHDRTAPPAAAADPPDPFCGISLYDWVYFAHDRKQRYKIASMGRHPIADGGGYYFELDLLPGFFAPHLFVKATP